MSCESEQGEGQLLSYDGNPVSFDALQGHKYKIIFGKIPNTIFFLQGFTFPSVMVEKIITPTPILDIDQVGEKIVFSPFSINFAVDSQMNNYFELFKWMERMTVRGDNIDEVGDAILIINDAKKIKFTDAWPTLLGDIQFDSNVNESKYVTCKATFNYDYFEITT